MLVFRKLVDSDKYLLTTWFNGDDVGMKFLSTYSKPEDYFHLIDFKKRYFWIVVEDGDPIGFFDFEIDNPKIGYFVVYLVPKLRGKGMGYEVLHTALTLPEMKNVEVLEGGVEKDNLASIKTLEKAGFKYAYTDEDDMLMYQLHVS